MSRQVSEVLQGFTFLLAPTWHDERIWVVDFYSNRVVSANADGSDKRVEAEMPDRPSGLGWLPDGRLMILSMHDRKLLVRDQPDTLGVHADLEPFIGGPPNDMVVDERGRAFVGNYGFDLRAGAPFADASLVRVDIDGTVTVVADELLVPNGLVITPDGVLIVAEMFGSRLSAFDIADDGSLSNRRVWAAFGEAAHTTDVGEALGELIVAPDGMCLDADGAIWVADAMHGRVLRVRAGGQIIDEVQTDGGAYACMLGGSTGTTLYICSAPDFDEHARAAAHEGKLLAVAVDVPRAGLP